MANLSNALSQVFLSRVLFMALTVSRLSFRCHKIDCFGFKLNTLSKGTLTYLNNTVVLKETCLKVFSDARACSVILLFVFVIFRHCWELNLTPVKLVLVN